MALFLSNTINKIDKKGRVSVPASFRAVLQTQESPGVVLFRSLHQPIVEGCSFERMMQLSQQYDSLSLEPTATQNNYQSFIFAEAQLLSFDAEGRISIPPSLLEHASIVDQIAFVGRGATFELWNPEQFKAHHEELRNKLQQGGSNE
ncbi:division/cell wall cluster transcriptional repressor MraZ [Candidatus Paracaedibacter symbiosus]|uniref:division/cell wall cluster transcriptional repressor MraZ n=1 Tax=Candidatus Paracaedibacter symbiosus TaxID=244582 RepID=UPI000509D889|nr:division/cell wall cluster transcriptional repressor MraZ [Candidatus Paracaedibacter symbiosus]